MSENSSFQRSRNKPPSTTTSPFCLRLSAAQREELESRAGRAPLGAFIRAQLFSDSANLKASRPRNKPRIKDHKALAEVLAKLGASRLASNINQLAKAVNTGSLPVTPETESALRAACRDIRAIKKLLMKALGMRER